MKNMNPNFHKTMKRNLLLIVAMIATVIGLTTACNNFDSDMEDAYILQQNPRAVPQQDLLLEADNLFPDGDVIPFLVYPRDGWTVSEGEVVLFKALLLDAATGKYVDVTSDPKCHFDASYGSGKSVNGSDPSLRDGQQITVRVTYESQWYSESTGTFRSTAQH